MRNLKKLFFPTLLALVLLASCGAPTAEQTPSADPEVTLEPTPTPTLPSEPSPTPYDGPLNPLTGLPMGEDRVDKRPVAVMLNNLKAALPQQGQSQADIIYEVLTEGGITRMLGVYQSLEDVGTIGSVRSTRTCFLELALGHDAILIHAGGSEEAYSKISAWNVTSLDGVRGPYMSNTVGGGLMWRDPDRLETMAVEHTVVTSGEKIQDTFENYYFRQEHESGYTYDMAFAEDGTPQDGKDAVTMTVRYSNYKTGVFSYDPESQLYMVEQYGKPYEDGNTGEQVGVTNVLILYTTCRNTGDAYGHVDVDLSSGGSGYFACGGKAVEIRWSKSSPDGQLRYTDKSGNPITLGAGRSYVNIVPTNAAVTIE